MATFPQRPTGNATTPPAKSEVEGQALVENSSLYKEFLAEREEILRHKWIESEKAGYDIGFEQALLDWIVKHRAAWRKNRMQRYMEQRHSTSFESSTESSSRNGMGGAAPSASA